MMIYGTNGAGEGVHVNGNGEIEAHAISAAEQEIAARKGDGYNFNTSNITLTDDLLTPLFFLKNDTEDRGIILPRIFVTFGASTAGAGDIEGTITYNPTGGSILTDVAKAPENFNTGQTGKTLLVTSTIGATGSTVIGGTTPIEFLFPSDSSRHLVSFQSIVIPRGGSIVFSIKPPTANTSIKVQAGYNAFLAPVA